MISGLAYVEIVVSNFQLSIDWYTNLLGFSVSDTISNEDGLWCQLASPNNETHLALWQPVLEVVNSTENQKIIPIFTTTNLRLFSKNLSENGVVFLEDIRERPGYLITTIADPDGNQLQLLEKIV